jgi:hypothetical protein
MGSKEKQEHNKARNEILCGVFPAHKFGRKKQVHQIASLFSSLPAVASLPATTVGSVPKIELRPEQQQTKEEKQNKNKKKRKERRTNSSRKIPWLDQKETKN